VVILVPTQILSRFNHP